MGAGPTDRVPWWAWGWWALVGALLGYGVAALLTIGVFLLLAAAVLVVVGLRVPALRGRAALGVVGGLAGAPLLLAWLNRDGPGTVCRTTPTSQTCGEQWSPWPFVVVALVLLVTCVALARRTAART